MEIKRERYLNQLIQFKWDGMVKVVTGIRRSGKSYLLNVLFRNYLKEQGVDEDHILFFIVFNESSDKCRKLKRISVSQIFIIVKRKEQNMILIYPLLLQIISK